MNDLGIHSALRDSCAVEGCPDEALVDDRLCAIHAEEADLEAFELNEHLDGYPDDEAG